MIRKLYLKAFKCFSEQKILFAPLTLLTGLNSSGKSSVFQAIRICREQQIINGLGSIGDLRCVSSREYPYISVEFSNGNTSQCFFNESDMSVKDKDNYLDNVYYISADRFGPRVNLPYKSQASDVGENGENVYAFLSQYRTQGGIPELLRHESHPEVSGVFEQIRAWLDIISPGVIFDFQIHNSADISVGSFADFRPTNVGFGLSYTLPIIASVLINASRVANISNIENVTLLIENPEAHLHPKGQTQMGYFLSLASQCGVQCIIETHSEHILNGIRIAVKEGIVPCDHAIFHYFVKNNKEEVSEVNSIFIDKYGMLDVWPEGFFDESERNIMRLL